MSNYDIFGGKNPQIFISNMEEGEWGAWRDGGVGRGERKGEVTDTSDLERGLFDTCVILC